jgi:hypothetical protein
MLDQCPEVGDILANAPRSGGALALAVPATIIGEDPKRLGQGRDD